MGVPTVGGAADAEPGGNIIRNAAGLQVLGNRRFRMLAELRRIPGGEFFVDGVNPFPLVAAFRRLPPLIRVGIGLFRDYDSAFGGQQMYGIREVNAFPFHYEAEYIAAFAAAETVVMLALFIDVERRGFLLVKRAQGLPGAMSGFFDRNIASDYIGDVAP